jgi:hypothetical protein
MKNTVWHIGAVAAALSLIGACSNPQKQAAAEVRADNAAAAAADMKRQAADPNKPAAVEVLTVRTSATVQSIDRTSRTVTLKNEAGAITTYKCGPEVRNFDQINVGDHVKAEVVDSLAVFVGKATEPSVTMVSATALAPKGSKPGVIMADTSEITAKVVSVDSAGHAIAVTGPMGRTRSFSVNPAIDLSGVKVGDDVVVRCTQGLAIVVEKAD